MRSSSDMTSDIVDSAEDGEVQRPPEWFGRFSMLASAIAARRVAVTPHSGLAYTDGQAIYVDSHATRDDVRDAVAMQAALIAAGSLQRDTLLRLSPHRRIAAERYLFLEAARLATHMASLLPPATVRRVRTDWSGTVPITSAQSLKRALSGATVPPVPSWLGTLKVLRLLRAGGADPGNEPGGSNGGGVGEVDDLDPELNEDEESDSERSKILELLSSPLSSPLSDALRKFFGMGGASSDGGGGAELPVASHSVRPVGPKAKRARAVRALATIFESTPAVGIRYPEWDVNEHTYRPDWCAVAEYDPPESEAPSAVTTFAGSMRKPLARVGIEQERHRRKPDGDAVDLSAVVDYVVSRRLGDSPEPLIYEQMMMTKRDLSVLILLDATGSTNEEADGRSIFEEERQLAGQLTASLEDLGDRVATFAFYSRGRESVRFLRVKGFEDRFDTVAKRRLHAVEPSGFTRLGAAVRHGSNLLQSQAQAKNMLLILVGDGLPYEDGYENAYARADTRCAIQEAVWSGIGVVGLAIRSSVDPEVHRDIWSEVPFRVVQDVDDARKYVRSLFLEALSMTRANGRRRDASALGDHGELQRWMARGRKLNSYV